MLITELSLRNLFKARDAVVMLKDLGFDDDWLWNLEKQIKLELSIRQINSLPQETNPNVFNRLFRPVGELLKEV